MNTHTLWITAIALCLSACSKQEPAELQPPENDQAAAPADQVPVRESEYNEAFMNHMHEHAAKLDDLMYALADDDLVGAGTPAYWLSQHATLDGIPEEWKNYVTRMRNAAYEVETASDLDTARAAAIEISAQCQGCHTVAGVNVLD